MFVSKKPNIFQKKIIFFQIYECFEFEYTGGYYDYNNFFTEQIMKKKLDHSYRVFKKVNRSAENFPTAKEYSWGEKNINVWCSNDYLGMSAHPKVKAAVR